MDNITFTAEQKEQLKNNVRAIERYIEENVVPYITGDVRLEFGGIYHCPRTGSPTAMYTLCVRTSKIYREESLSNFEFWSGAISNAEEFTLEELDRIGEELETLDCEGDGYDETQINDLMWFEPEYLASLIGLEWDSETGKVIR